MSAQPGKITLTNKQILHAASAIQTLQAARASGPFKLRLARMAAVLRTEQELIQQQILDMRAEYIELDENKNPKQLVLGGREIPGSISWKDKAGFEAASKTLLDAEHEIEILNVTEAELTSLEFEGDIEGLLPLLKAD